MPDREKSTQTPRSRPRNDEYIVAERARLSRVVSQVLGVCLAACVVMFLYGVITRDPTPMLLCSVGIVGFSAAFVVLRRGGAEIAAFMLSLVALTVVAMTAGTGLGLHDLSGTAIPVIIMFSGLTLNRRQFIAMTALSLVFLLFVVGNQHYVWIPLRRTVEDETSQLLISGIVAIITAYAVWMLTRSSHAALRTAHLEIDRRIEVEQKLEEMSTRDALTGVYSRHFFDAEHERLERTKRYPVSVIIADLDNLKRVNDSLGHAAGDRLIMQAAEVLSSVIRAEDVLSRIGGDEFAILLPDTDATAVSEVANRIEVRLAALRAAGMETLSLSVGTATTAGIGLTEALSLADARMYEQKSGKKTLPGIEQP